ncbi:FAD-dependent oxidoreductase [Sinorhizobium sp. BG8]|uniref:NAD(P)/FAD-dependent oxidoreductase n=1 Tax=Sinorhizobium sp. BG8 TaxID=2613773 RepID=UPI00193C9E6D|nr:FAD-dependent oxidoreductase [Sinorhizobium sp. BG8]QRM57086.1 FAD-dependent oxidoreductase [Sinorhizobium sp. BG8]
MPNHTRFDAAQHVPVWQDALPKLPALPPLDRDISADLAIVGGGFVGLWCALKARERWPDAHIVVIEAGLCGDAASGRNGGFCAPSISHGVSNAATRWRSEAETLVRLGRQNLDDFEEDLATYGMDCEFQRCGKLNVAARPWQIDALQKLKAIYDRLGIEAELLTGPALRRRLDSPVYSAGLFETNYALIHPGKLVSGLRATCLANGIEIYEKTRATELSHSRDGAVIDTPEARLTASKVALATNAEVPLLRQLRRTILPVFDYSLATAPLTEEQFKSIGWTGDHGIADTGNQFHYFRKTADNRILWGGYDAIYYRGWRRDGALLDREKTFSTLAANFSAAFPSLDGVKFDYSWGGIIDTSARMTLFAGTSMQGQLAYALGFTGQGVSASRFAALVMLDLLEGRRTERTELRMVRSFPVPFPPEPLTDFAVRWSQRDLAREDETGRRSLMLRAMDRLGIGFAS